MCVPRPKRRDLHAGNGRGEVHTHAELHFTLAFVSFVPLKPNLTTGHQIDPDMQASFYYSSPRFHYEQLKNKVRDLCAA